MSLNLNEIQATKSWNEARVFGDLLAPQHQSVLQRRMPVLRGLSAKQPSGTWIMWNPTYAELIDKKLSKFRVSTIKQGQALVYAEGVHNGHYFSYDKTTKMPLSGREYSDIRSITFAGFDVDNGASFERAQEAMIRKGLAGIQYTTHSHKAAESEIKVDVSLNPERAQEIVLHEARERGLKAMSVASMSEPDENHYVSAVVIHEPLDKFRLLLPLDEPFELHPSEPTRHREECTIWRERCEKLGNDVLELDIDESGCDANRLFYIPSCPPDSDVAQISIYAGRPLGLSEIPPATSRAVGPMVRRRGQRADAPKLGRRPILSDGFDLIDWRRDHGKRFKICEFFEWLMWETGRFNPAHGEARIMCPNDQEHSTLGDMTACWIKDGNGHEAFALFCHHNTCRELGALELLVALENEAVLPDQYETLSSMLCDEEFYTEDGAKAPVREQYLRWDPRPAKRTGGEASAEVVV